MTERLDRLRAAVRRPLPLAYHPLYRFYEGGSLTRQFRGLPDRPDDWWSEDWVGSCTTANNCDPDGRAQGMSPVDLPGIGTMTLGDGAALEVADEIDTDDGRFCVAVVASGDGWIDGDFGSQPIGRGETYALPASLPFRVRAGREPLRVVRCFGPAAE
jgi:hypothetical protein